MVSFDFDRPEGTTDVIRPRALHPVAVRLTITARGRFAIITFVDREGRFTPVPPDVTLRAVTAAVPLGLPVLPVIDTFTVVPDKSYELRLGDEPVLGLRNVVRYDVTCSHAPDAAR
eukprot:jgi/Tetstr1/454244/TSEL_041163.t1